jgi:nucleoside-diphosphate-sugar epimerase
MPSALVFGGAGQMGAAVAERLLSCGWQVWVVTRAGRSAPANVIQADPVSVDGTDRSRHAVLEGLGRFVDAVFDPTAYDAADAADLLQARGRFGSLVVVSTASVYAAPGGRPLLEVSLAELPGPTQPLVEDAPTVAPGDTSYATRKVALEHALLESGAPVSILRPCAV